MLQMDSSSFWAHFELGRGYEQKGMVEEAIAELNRATTLAKHMTWAIGALGHAYGVSGQKSQAQRVLDQLKELSKQRYVSPSDIAVVQVGLGEKDQAVASLQKAYQERSWYMVLLKLDPRLDSLQSDPRFQDLVRKVGLPR
jgi:Flp pilus assembly protein TadD